MSTDNDTAGSDHPITRGNKFIWINKYKSDVSKALARISSPEYQNSGPACTLAYWYYIAGDLGGATVTPLVHIVETTE